MIERRNTSDKYILIAGMVITCIIMFLTVKYFIWKCGYNLNNANNNYITGKKNKNQFNLEKFVAAATDATLII